MTPYARPSVPQDAHLLAPRLRKEDVEEIRAASGNEPLQALLNGILEGTECWTIIGNGDEVLGLFGVNHMPEYGPGQACVWMLAADGLPSIRAEFFKQTPEWIAHFHTRFPVLWNYIDARQTMHIRWLKRLGFRFIKQHEAYGHEQRPFYQFVRHAPVESEVIQCVR